MEADRHDTPVGFVTGALIHANWIEAVMSGRIFPAIPAWALKTIEVITGFAAAVVFAAISGLGKKLITIIASVVLLILFQWIALQLFGTFLDAFVLVVALGLHAILDRLLGDLSKSSVNEKVAAADI